MVRFVHSADWQLGMTRAFLGVDAQARLTAARLDAVRSLGRLAQAEGAAFVVVCGDVFEANHVDRGVVLRAAEALAEVPVPVYLVPGNHDPLDASSVLRSLAFTAAAPAHVHVVTDSRPIAVAPGVELVGAPWASKRPGRDLVAEALADLPADGTVRVLAGHGALDVLSPDRHDPARIALAGAEAALADGRIHFVALGDRHSTTSVGASGRVWYAGAPEPTDFDELDPGNALVVELAPGGCSVVPHPVGTWRFVEHEVELTSAAGVEALARWAADLHAKDRTVVRLTLHGALGLADAARLEAVLADACDVLAALQRWEKRSTLVVLPSPDDVDALDLTGFAATAADELRRAAQAGGPDGAAAADALALLHRLVLQGAS